MEQTADTLTASAAPPAESEASPPTERGPFGVLVGMLIRPRATFEALREAKHRHGWLVVVLMIVATALLAYASYSVRLAAFANFTPPAGLTQQGGAGDAGATGGTQTFTATALSPLTSIGLPVVTGTVGALLGYGLTAVVIYGMGLLMGGKASFRQLLPVAVWSTLPLVLRKIMHAAVTLISGSSVAAGFSGLLTFSEAASMPLFATLLGQFDIYLLWSLLLLGIGVAVTAKLSRGKTLIIVLVDVVLFAGLIAAGSALSGVASNLTGVNLPGLPGTRQFNGGGGRFRGG